MPEALALALVLSESMTLPSSSSSAAPRSAPYPEYSSSHMCLPFLAPQLLPHILSVQAGVRGSPPVASRSITFSLGDPSIKPCPQISFCASQIQILYNCLCQRLQNQKLWGRPGNVHFVPHCTESLFQTRPADLSMQSLSPCGNSVTTVVCED